MAAILTIAIILSGIAVMVLLSGIALYNRLVTLRALVRSARSDMEKILSKTQARESGRTWAMEDALLTFSEAVRDYNTAIETFPANIIARWFGLEKEKPVEGLPGDEKN